MVTTGKLTYDDLDCLLDDDGNLYEIIDGEIVVSPQPFIAHQRISSELVWRLNNHVMRYRLGRIFHAPTGVLLGPHDVFEPDVLFVSNERMAFLSERGIEGPPDLCIEIASPSAAARDRTVKYDRYARYGVREYWIVDPEARTIAVFALDGAAFVVHGTASGREIVPSRLLPRLRLRAASLFPPQ